MEPPGRERHRREKRETNGAMAEEITLPPPPVPQPAPRTAPAAIWSLISAGPENNTNAAFLHTTVDDDEHFQQILAWTLKSRWQKQNELLREITRTFRSESTPLARPLLQQCCVNR